ncbi:MAG: hypothetical protein E6J41_07140 [Chloroflexi bacterium]|nr:MAG: hypothetical protein E6J41_07140 [Chloroflexota bacterium]
MLTPLTGILWRLLARMRLCLAGVDDAEVGRLLVRRLRWMVVFGGLAAGCVVLAATTATETVAAPSPVMAAMRTDLQMGAYIAAGVLALPVVAVWRYAQAIVRRALRDRAAVPQVCRGTALRVVPAAEGGWPMLLRREDGRRFWVTGSAKVLAPVRSRMGRAGPGFRVTVTVQYYRRSRVVKEIRGMAVEALSVAWSPALEAGAEPATP